MSGSLLDMLAPMLSGGVTSQIGENLGVDQSVASTAIASALPTLLGALARNSSSSEGAGALAGALDRDHDGSILDDIGGFLGQAGAAAAGAAILRHTLGGKQEQVQTGIGKASGLDAGQVGQLLAMLAPVVMGALGKAKRDQDLDADGLGTLLGQEQERAERRAPGIVGMIGNLLDADGDGDFKDDVAEKAIGMLGSLFGGK